MKTEFDESVGKNDVHPMQWWYDIQDRTKLEGYGIGDIFDALRVFHLYEFSRWDSQRDYVTIKCPFHEDKTPSLVVWRTINGFKCYGCGCTGNLSQFVYRMEVKNKWQTKGIQL